MGKSNVLVRCLLQRLVLVTLLVFPSQLLSKDFDQNTSKTQNQTQVEEKNTVIIGSGIAGLTALHRLREQKIDVVVYEADSRNGGRIREDFEVEDRVLLNAGAELVDSDNSELLRLLKDMEIKILPRFSTSKHAAYFYNVDGKWLSHPQLMEKIFKYNKKVLRKLYLDQVKIERKDSEVLQRLDQITMYEYLNRMGSDPTFMQYVQAGTLSELGRDLQELSARVFFDQVEIDLKNKNLEFLPHHDEAWIVEGGTYRLVKKISSIYQDRIFNENILYQVVELKDGSFHLYFKNSNGNTRIVHAQNVIVTIPPHQWDDVIWKVQAPVPLKLEKLQYARNSKVVLFFNKKFWEKGTVLGLGMTSNNGFQIWDTTIPGGNRAALTIFTESFSDSATPIETFVREAIQQLDELFPGIKESFVKFKAYDWPYSYTSADKVLDKTLVSKTPEMNGRLLFAGEVFGGEFQGYLEGAVRSGESTARKIISTQKNRMSCASLF